MAPYGELSKAFERWRDSFYDHRDATLRFCSALRDGLKEYLCAPEPFVDNFPGADRPKPYVAIARATRHEDNSATFDGFGESPRNLIANEEEGYFFGLCVVLESDPNTWPKQTFCVPTWVQYHSAESANVRIFNQSFSGSPSDIKSFDNAFSFIEDYLQRLFAQDFSKYDEKPLKIGFLRPLPEGEKPNSR